MSAWPRTSRPSHATSAWPSNAGSKPSSSRPRSPSPPNSGTNHVFSRQIRRNPLVAVIAFLLIVLAVGLLIRSTPSDTAPAGPEIAAPTMPTLELPIVVPPIGEIGPTLREYADPTGSPSAGPATSIDPTGLRATDAWTTVAGPRTLFEAVSDAIGAPVRSMEVRVEGKSTPLLLSPLEYAVASDGRIDVATPLTLRFLGLVAALLGAAWLGVAAAYAHRSHREIKYGYGAHAPHEGSIATIVSISAFVWIWSALFQGTDAWTIALVVALVGTNERSYGLRMLYAGWACFLAGFVLLAQVELTDPLVSLAGSYGRMGIHVWDVVAIAGAMSAFLVWRISRIRFDRSVTVHAPHVPLVQDIRIVERR